MERISESKNTRMRINYSLIRYGVKGANRRFLCLSICLFLFSRNYLSNMVKVLEVAIFIDDFNIDPH